jgi:hypothetical protein
VHNPAVCSKSRPNDVSRKLGEVEYAVLENFSAGMAKGQLFIPHYERNVR